MKKAKEQIIKGFKGFDSELKCRDKQYKVGKTHKEDVTPKACEVGMHFCESPFEVFGYYEPNRSRYCMVEGSGKLSKHDDKIACTQLKVNAEIGLSGIIQAGVKFNLEKVEWADKTHTEGDYSGASATGNYSGASATGDYSGASATGNRSGASATGNGSGASATGDYSGASATGDYSGASATGDKSGALAIGYKVGASATGNCSIASAAGTDSSASAGKGSIAVAVGVRSKAKGETGSYIVLAEYEAIRNDVFIKDVKAAKVDGDIIKADTWYSLVNGEFREVNL